MPAPRPLLLASEAEEMARLARCLDAEVRALPPVDRPDTFEGWRTEILSIEPRKRIVVSLWRSAEPAQDLVELDGDEWIRRFEAPYLLWNFALGAAGRLCSDGGAIVAVNQAPAALDAPGRTPELAIADGVFSLVRSVAAAEGPRGVRANLVTTPIGLVDANLIAPSPPLDGFPGTIESHVAGAVRSFLSEDAAGLTGRVLSADGGRSL